MNGVTALRVASDTVAPSDNDPIFARLVADVPVIQDAATVSVSMLPGGLSNTNYLVDADGEMFVVRHACDNAELLGIDRRREESAARQAHAAGFAPEIIVFLQPEGHAVFRYLPDAHPPTVEQFTAPEMVARVARRMRDVHDLPPIAGTFDPFAVIDRWRVVLNERGSELPTRLGGLIELVEAARATRQTLPIEDLVVCHNDPYHLNFLDDGRLWLIDWEYAGMGDPMYDLAGVGLNLDRDGRDVLLRSYYGAATPEMHHRLELLIPVFLCWNTMWCLIQVGEGAAEFDYFAMAEEYLDLVSPQPTANN
ncbi:MAG: phosphotransferase [Actinomycetota bacterium]